MQKSQDVTRAAHTMAGSCRRLAQSMAGGRRGHQTRAATSREVYLHSIVGAYCWSFKVVIPTRIFSLPCVVLNSIVPESSWLTPPSHLESATRPPAAATNTPSPLSSVLHDPLPCEDASFTHTRSESQTLRPCPHLIRLLSVTASLPLHLARASPQHTREAPKRSRTSSNRLVNDISR